MEPVFIVMGICETGEHFRYCQHDFSEFHDALWWIHDHADDYPESQLYAHERKFYPAY